MTAWRPIATVGNGVSDPATSPAVPATRQAFPFKGLIDEVAIYDKPLTPVEVSRHHAARAEAPYKLTTTTLASGRVWATNTYDARTDRLATHTDQHGGTWQIGAQLYEAQSGAARVTVVDPRGEELKYVYDAWRGYRLIGATDQLGHTTWHEYTLTGSPSKVIDRNGIVTDVYYDERNNLIGRKYCRAPGECAVESWTYHLNATDPFDPRNDRVTVHRDGRSNSDTDTTYAATTEYTTHGEVVKVTTPATPDFPTGRSAVSAYSEGTEPAVGGGTTPAGLVITSARDALGRVTSRIEVSAANPDGVTSTFTYDNLGRVLTQTGPGVKNEITDVTHTTQSAVAYDADGNTLTDTVTDLTGGDPARTTTSTYDAAGNVIKKALTGAGSARTESTAYAYNTLGQVTRQTVENGDDDLVSTSTYDDRGLLISTVDPRGNAAGASAADFTSTLRYDLAGRLVESKAPQVKIDKAGSAADGRPTVKQGYNNAGLLTQTVDAEGRTVTSVFDKAGRLTSTVSPSYTPPGGDAVTPKVGYGYDAAGRMTSAVDPRGYVTSTEYDALGRPVRVTDPGPSGPGGQWVTEFDLAGEPLAVIDPTGSRSEATFDDLGRKITATQIERRPTTAALTTTLTYDTAGNLTKSVAPGAKSTGFTVNAAGQVTAVTDPNTNKSTIGYDFLGRTAKVTDPLGNATEADYDLAGRQIAAKDLASTGAVVRTLGFGYDPAGNPTTSTSGEGHLTQRQFDALGRMTALIEPVSANKSITSTFGYDASGARTRSTDGRGNATWTGYNTLGLAETVIEPATAAHPGAADRTWTTLYDAAGNATATLQPGGVRIDRTFDPLGQLVKQSGSGASVATPERTLSYDEAGRPTAIGDYTLEYNDRGLLTKAKATNQIAAYAYDALGNPTQRVDATGTATYTYDNASRLKTAGDPVTGRTFTYGYDTADRLTSKTSATPAGTQSYGYDAVDRLTSQTLKNSGGTELSKIVYGWDQDDNLTTKTTSGTAGAGASTYGYDHAGRLTSWTAPGGASTAYAWDDSGNRTAAGDKTFAYDERNRLTSGAGVDYTYTPRGTVASETKAGVTRNLVFDAFDRMISDGEAGYGYDALGRMTSRTQGVTQQRFIYSGLDNDIAVVADAAGAVQAKYGRDPSGGLLSLQEGTGPALGVMSDLHGDVVATFSGTALVDSTAYDPFGQVTHRSGTARTLGYQGEYTDPDTGKVNMHARWYQPGTGAFTSRDTATLDPNPSVQANRYSYANAVTLSHTDPTGHNALCASSCAVWNDPSSAGSGAQKDWSQRPTTTAVVRDRSR